MPILEHERGRFGHVSIPPAVLRRSYRLVRIVFSKVKNTSAWKVRMTEAAVVTIHLDRRKVSVPLVPGETLLETARREGLDPPFNCEAGNCGTCMARLTEGSATMRVNDALDDDEVADGYILTCQGIPDTTPITVHYE
jgi:ferredoxin